MFKSHTFHHDSGMLASTNRRMKRSRKSYTFDGMEETAKDSPKKFRFVDEALNYDFIHKPFEDKTIKQKAERDEERRKKMGVSGDPNKTALRFINKIFDLHRNKSKLKNKCLGCDLEFNERNSFIKVGEATLGALKTQQPEYYNLTKRSLNIDLEGPEYEKVAVEIANRPMPETAFEGDNTYRNLSSKKPKNRNFSDFMNYTSTPDKTTYGKSLSSNYYYFGKLSKP